MKEQIDSYAYFWITGDFTASDITQIIGISPSHTFAKGDNIPSRPGKTRDHSNWELHSPLPRNVTFIDSHLKALMELLERKKEIIKNLQTEYETGINCVGYYTNSNPGFHLNKHLVQQLAELNLDIDFDLYCYCDHEDETTT